jgi:hypothetical protein
MYGIPEDLGIATLRLREKTFLMIWYSKKLEITPRYRRAWLETGQKDESYSIRRAMMLRLREDEIETG